MIEYAVIFAVSLVFAWLFSPLLPAFCHKIGLIDIANDRSAHKDSTPRGGGVLIVLVTLPLFGYGLLSNLLPQTLFHFLVLLVPASFFIAVLGFCDDRWGLSAKVRWLSQFLIAAVCVSALPHIELSVPMFFEKVILVFAWVWFINLFNFMDGMDGYASAEAIFIAVGISLLAPIFLPFTLPLIGSCLGFLRVNRPKAKVFLGDVGSLFLGFILGGLLLAAFAYHASLLGYLLAVSLLFTADSTYTLLKRILQKKKPWKAHREHWYQRAYNLGKTHGQILLGGCFINLSLLCIVVVGLYFQLGLKDILIAFVPLVLAGILIKKLELASRKK